MPYDHLSEEESASNKWQRLNGHALIQDVIARITFIDGVEKHAA